MLVSVVVGLCVMFATSQVTNLQTAQTERRRTVVVMSIIIEGAQVVALIVQLPSP